MNIHQYSYILAAKKISWAFKMSHNNTQVKSCDFNIVRITICLFRLVQQSYYAIYTMEEW